MDTAAKPPADPAIPKRTARKVAMRLLPYLFLLYVVAFIDRVNFGYAALQMDAELGIGNAAFGFAAGIFFLGYFLFEIPSNLILHRVGARKWISRILISWGLVVMLTGFVYSIRQLLWLRFILGIAEAGFFPGIILYLTFWFRAGDRARAVALFMTALAVSNIIGAPVSTWLLDHADWLDMQGWRWLFIIEGAPAVLLGVFNWFYLPDRPSDAGWLTREEKTWLQGELDLEMKTKQARRAYSVGQVFKEPKVLLLALIYFFVSMGLYTSAFWLPQVISGFGGLTHSKVGMIIIIPYTAAAAAMIWWSCRSDRSGERRRHAALALFAGATGFLLAASFGHPAGKVFALSLAIAGLYSAYGPFWAMPSLFLGESAAAAAIALINSVGNLGGFAGPYILGVLKDRTGGAGAGWLCTAGGLALGGMLILAFLPREEKGGGQNP